MLQIACAIPARMNALLKNRSLFLALMMALLSQPAVNARTQSSSPEPATVELETVSYVTYAAVADGTRMLESCRFSADGRRLLVNLDNPRQRRDIVRVYDVATGNELFSREARRPETVVMMGDGISRDGSRVLFTVTDAQLVRTANVAEVNGGRVIWSQRRGVGDDRFVGAGDLVVASEIVDNTRRLSLTNVTANKLLWQTDLEKGLYLPVLATSEDGRYALAYRDAKRPDPSCVYDLERREVVASLEQSARASALHFSAIGGRMGMVGIVDQKLTQWDLATGGIVKQFPLKEITHPANQILFSPDGRRLYVRAGNTITARRTADGVVAAVAMSSIPIDMIEVGPGGLIVSRMFPGKARIARLKEPES
jgi:dipeptidyl aminopeptidase/acylaminoacyl peptidase